MKLTVWLKILNKNLNPTTHQPNEYIFDEDCIYTNNYNETLDSFSGRISHINEIDIEPYDECEVIFRNENSEVIKTLYFCVDTYTITQITRGIDNERFNYDISLFSQTKLLEGVICPNLSITPYKLESGKTRKSVFWYLSQYINWYAPRRRYYDDEDHSYDYLSRWGLSQNVRDKFSNVDAPEMQWNTPTLREVITDLMMVKDCIPILRNGVIDLIDLTHKNEPEISESAINYIQKSQSADNYVSEIKMNLQNVMQTQLANVKNVCTTSEYLTFTTDGAIITSDNVILKTNFPILNIKHLWMGVFGYQGNSCRLVFIDLCNLSTGDNIVKEKQEYDTLPIAYRPRDVVGKETNYQNYNLYYTRGSNVINGLVDLTQKNAFENKISFELIRDYIKKLYPSLSITNANGVANAYFSTFFKIEYETMTDQVFMASKDGVKNKRVIVDNQTNSWVDAYSQGFLEYQKANRLGNQVVMYNQRTTNFVDLIEIGDYKGDNVVYQVQYQIYQEHIEVNAYATKNYILRNYWTGVSSKIRTWVNAKDEALVRHELIKYYCNVDFNTHDELGSYDADLGRLCAKAISDQTRNDYPLQFAMIRTGVGGYYMPSYVLEGCNVAFNLVVNPNYFTDTLYLDFDVKFDCHNVLKIDLDTGHPLDANGQPTDNPNEYVYENQTFSHILIMGGANSFQIRYKTDEETPQEITVYTRHDGWTSSEYGSYAYRFTYNWRDISACSNASQNLSTILRSMATITGGKVCYYACELLSRVMGSSIVFTTGFDDNVVYGRSRVNTYKNELVGLGSGNATPHLKSDFLEANGGIQTQIFKYTDDFGEFNSINVKMYSQIYNEGKGYMDTDGCLQYMIDLFRNPIVDYENGNLRPKANSIWYDETKSWVKDNKEIFKLSVQFEYYSGNENIYLGSKLANNNSFVRDKIESYDTRRLRYFVGNNTELKVEKTPSNAIEIFNQYDLQDIQMDVVLIKVNNGITKVRVRDYGRNFGGNNTLYLTDELGNVLLSCRYTTSQVQEEELSIYFNIVKDRDLRIYDYEDKVLLDNNGNDIII